MYERLTTLEDKQMDIMIRLNNLSKATGALGNKTGKNREMAKEAKNQVKNATEQASSLDQVCVGFYRIKKCVFCPFRIGNIHFKQLHNYLT